MLCLFQFLRTGAPSSRHCASGRWILTLTGKYQINAIRRRVVKHIEADWPSDLAEWNIFEEEIRAKEKLVIDADDYLWQMLPKPASSIRLARRHGIPQIFPAVCFHLARIPTKYDYSIPESFGFDMKLAPRWSHFSIKEFRTQSMR